MESVYRWARNFICCLCLLELFCHLVRNEDYRRYIRFFGGLLVLMLVISPLAEIFSLGETFGEELRQAFAAEEARELTVSQGALSGLQNEKISEAYEKELKRQIGEIVKAYGQQPLSVTLRLEEQQESAALLTGVSILLASAKSAPGDTEGAQAAKERQQEEIGKLRTEISAVYGVEREAVTVSVKEQG